MGVFSYQQMEPQLDFAEGMYGGIGLEGDLYVIPDPGRFHNGLRRICIGQGSFYVFVHFKRVLCTLQIYIYYL